MKKIFTKSFLLIFSLLLSTGLLKAQLLTSEDFNFSGALSANGWSVHSGAPTNPITTTTGLSYAGLLGTGVGNAAMVNNLGGQDENIVFASQNTDGQSIYTSMLVNVTDPAATKSGDYFFNLGDGGGTTFTFFAARVFAKITASGVNFGVSNGTAEYGTTNFAKNTTYLLIVKYTISTSGNDPISLWVLPSGVPATEAAAGTPELVHTSTNGQSVIRALALRQGSASNSVQTVVDAIKVGLTWADVTPANSTLPSLTATGGTITDFNNVVVGTSSASQSYSLSGTNLTGAPGNIVVSTGPSVFFELSTDNSTWSTSINVPFTSATLAPTTIYIRFSPQSTGSFVQTVSHTGGGDGYFFNVTGTAIPAPTNPLLTAGSLASFGSVCLNTTAGANSFTLNGVNLTTADINVGPLAGYSFSTTAGGTYTPSLTLTQPGGTFTQDIFVKFTPTAIQSYNGNIAIAGAGTTAAINVAATGAGNNAAPSVTTGAATAITINSATVAGTISATGCTAVTAYGIEYSLTSGFANGTGTTAASTNLSAGNFSVPLSGLAANTFYYYKAYATNSGGTTYGTQQSFKTAAPVLAATPLTAFGTACLNTTLGPNSFSITSTVLGTTNVTVGPLAGYTFSTSSAGTYTNSLSIPQTGGAFSQTVFVKFTPTALQAYNGNIPVGGGGANTINVAVSGTGVNTTPAVTAGSASDIGTATATLAATITANGCSNVTGYGIEYSGINNFVAGSGTSVGGGTMDGAGNYTVTINGLVQGTTYYYRAYATNAGGTTYSTQASFTTTSIPAGLTLYSIPAQRNSALRFSVNNIKPDHYAVVLFNSNGQKVFRRDMIIQTSFINESIMVPNNITPGVYQFQLENNNGYIERKTIMIK